MILDWQPTDLRQYQQMNMQAESYKGNQASVRYQVFIFYFGGKMIVAANSRAIKMKISEKYCF